MLLPFYPSATTIPIRYVAKSELKLFCIVAAFPIQYQYQLLLVSVTFFVKETDNPFANVPCRR